MFIKTLNISSKDNNYYCQFETDKFNILMDVIGKTFIKSIMGILFGKPPENRDNFRNIMEDVKGSLVFQINEGKEYLIGRDFSQDKMEIFAYEKMRLIPMAPLDLMDILRKELGTLNPIDFEAIFLFNNKNLFNKSFIFWEFLNKGVNIELNDSYWNYQEEKDFNIKKEFLLEKCKKINNYLEKINSIQQAIVKIEEEINTYKNFGQVISPEFQTTLNKLSQQLTAVSLERKVIEEKVRDTRLFYNTISKEIVNLREKLDCFDKKVFSLETKEKVRKILRLKEDKTTFLERLQIDYISKSKKSFFHFSRNNKDLDEKKIKLLIEEIDQINKELNEIIKGRSIEDYLREFDLFQLYQTDLWRLEHTPGKKEFSEQELNLEVIIDQENEIKKLMEEILVKISGNDNFDFKTKINYCKELKKQQEQLVNEVKQDFSINETNNITDLLERAKNEVENKIEVITEQMKMSVIDKKTTKIYQNIGKFLSILTQERYAHVSAEKMNGTIKLKVKGENTEWILEDLLGEKEKKLLYIAFRLALVMVYSPSKKVFVVFENIFSNLHETEETLLLLFNQAEISNIQVVLLNNF